MKAIICERYGAPSFLSINEVSMPLIKPNEVLIKIKAATVATGDCVVRNATNPMIKLVFGWKRPRQPILGTDLAGIVVNVGSNVKKFKSGDHVIASTGMKFGGHAEYIAINENASIVKCLNTLSFAEATSIAFGGNAGLHYLRKANVKSGNKVLIYGASGAVGSSSIQLAKYFGAEVTGICSQKNVELVFSLGADAVVNYEEEGFIDKLGKFDLIFDAVGKTSKKNWLNNLSEQGNFFTVAKGLVKNNPDDLEILTSLLENKQLVAVIDRIYPMEQIIQAYEYVETGRKRGTVVLQIDSKSE